MNILIKVTKFIQEIYQEQLMSPICIKYAKICRMVTKTVVVTHTSILIQLILYPFVCYLIFGELEVAFPTYLPYVDHKSVIGSGIVVGIQIIMLICFWLMNSSYDLLMILIVLNVPMVSEFILMEIDELKKCINKRPKSSIEGRRRMVKIIRMLKKYDE